MVTITPRTVSLPLLGVVMKLSACIEWLFADETDDISQRVRKAAECGLYGVEFHLWRDKPLSDIRRALDETTCAHARLFFGFLGDQDSIGSRRAGRSGLDGACVPVGTWV